MTELLVILDPTDPDVFHTDVTCPALWSLHVRAERRTDGAVDGPEALVDQAMADGLLVLDGVVAGLRCCRGCRPGAAGERHPLPLAA